MSLKYVSAYLMEVVAGNANPSAADVKKVLKSIGANVDEDVLNTMMKNVQGKNVHELIASGMKSMQSVVCSAAPAAIGSSIR